MDLRALRRYPADVGRALREAPLEVAYALFLAAGFSWAVVISLPQGFQVWWETVFLVAIAVSAAWTGTLLYSLGRWNPARRWGMAMAGVAVGAVLVLGFLDMTREAEVWRAATIAVAAVTTALAAPAVSAGDRKLLFFRRVTGRLGLRLAGAALYGGALFVGLALALAAVDNLFALELEDEIYGHVFGWIAFAGVPCLVVGGIRTITRPVEDVSEVGALAWRVAAWLVLPLLALYLAILYAYTVRILVLGELPPNLVSPLVTVAGILSVVGLALFDRGPGADVPGAAGPGPTIRRALRLTPLLFLPLGALGVHAILVRVGQYGWTEFRYLRTALLVALSLLAIGATIQLLRRRPFAVHLAPPLAAGVMFLAVVGPWGAPSVSHRSQAGRLTAALEAAGIAPEGAASGDTLATRAVPDSLYREIASTARYLARHFGPGSVDRLVPASVAPVEGRDLPTALGLERIVPEGMRIVGRASLAPGTAVEAGGSTVLRIGWPDDGERRTAFLRDSLRISIPTYAGVLTADLEPLVRWMRAVAPEGEQELPGERAVLALMDSSGAEAGELIVLELRLGGANAPRPLTLVDALAVIEPRRP